MSHLILRYAKWPILLLTVSFSIYTWVATGNVSTTQSNTLWGITAVLIIYRVMTDGMSRLEQKARQQNIEKLFPITSNLTLEQQNFVSKDLQKTITELEYKLLNRRKMVFLTDEQEAQLQQIHYFEKQIVMDRITLEDISELNKLYGYHSTV